MRLLLFLSTWSDVARLGQAIPFPSPSPTLTAQDVLLNTQDLQPTITPVPTHLYNDWHGIGADLSGSANRTCTLYGPSARSGYFEDNLQGCGWATDCFDYFDVVSDKACDSSCMKNNFIHKCSQVSAPYCQSWYYPWDNIQDYGCGTARDSTWTMRYTPPTGYIGPATHGVPGAGEFTKLVVINYRQAPFSAGNRTAARGTGTGAIGTRSTRSTGTRGTGTTTDLLSQTDTSDSTGGHSSSNAGAIAGGTVGGVVGLAAVAAIAFLFGRRFKRSDDAPAPGEPPGNAHEKDGTDGAHESGGEAIAAVPATVAADSKDVGAETQKPPVEELPSPIDVHEIGAVGDGQVHEIATGAQVYEIGSERERQVYEMGLARGAQLHAIGVARGRQVYEM